jgi:hypothetical protein
LSRFLLNLLVQIFKAFVYSKIQILFGNNSPQLSAQPRPIPFFPTSRSPSPHWASASWPAQPARTSVVPYPVAPSSRGSASSRAAFALSSRPADKWTPPVIPHLRPTRARPRRHHLPSLPTPPSSTSDAARAFTTPPSRSPSLILLLTSPPPSMALTPLTPPLLPPATPLRRSPDPYKGR